MIIKSYEIEKKIPNLIKLNLILLYGENNGLKKDIRKIIIRNFKKEKDDIEFLSFYEDEILQNEENLHNAVFSGSLFSNKKTRGKKTRSPKLGTARHALNKYIKNAGKKTRSPKLGTARHALNK